MKTNTIKLSIITILMMGIYYVSIGQTDTTVYHLEISEKILNITGKNRRALAINNQIPGPTLRFKEGDYAIIYVKNNLNEETSVHWHGLILPNFYDGVPYLTTPPIEPGNTQKYEFPLVHNGTYWYHSHTGLQEQLGVYGSIIIEPKESKFEYDKDLVLVFSDWTDENPTNVLKNLKRRNEWYSIKRNTVTPLAKVIAEGGIGAQLNFWRQRMPGADIADVYYNAFLTNGTQIKEYPDFKPGDKVRVRMVNASASTYYWITFGGGDPTLISADGIDVVPVKKDKLLFAIAETYDFLITIPKSGKLEIRATSMDGAGRTSAYLGEGRLLKAIDIPRPDYVGIMKAMSKMDMKMGAPAMIANPKKNNGLKKMKKYGMQMEGDMKMDMLQHDKMPGMDMPKDSAKKEMNNKSMTMNQTPRESVLVGVGMGPDKGYDFLKSPVPTNFTNDKMVREIEFTLNGNMWRYIWSMNGKPLTESDKIKIKKGELVRITMTNLTMMNHPMHLHGHFFRVVNKNGEYSPLKHTLNVAPMQSITIEFDANEYGDWFFHCHILYHLEAGMARVFSYGTPRDAKLQRYPLSNLIKETNKYYSWSTAYGASHMTSIETVSSNVRNQWNIGAEFGWNNNFEADFSYERYLTDYFRFYGGINIENETPDSLNELTTVAQIGIRYLLPYFINADLSIDNKLRPQIRFTAEYLLFRRIAVFGRYEYRSDFGWVNTLESGKSYASEQVWNTGVDYVLNRNFSITATYDNRFGGGAGITYRF